MLMYDTVGTGASKDFTGQTKPVTSDTGAPMMARRGEKAALVFKRDLERDYAAMMRGGLSRDRRRGVNSSGVVTSLTYGLGSRFNLATIGGSRRILSCPLSLPAVARKYELISVRVFEDGSRTPRFGRRLFRKHHAFLLECVGFSKHVIAPE